MKVEKAVMTIDARQEFVDPPLFAACVCSSMLYSTCNLRMSLSSFLLGVDTSNTNDKSIDTGLNDLFKSTVSSLRLPNVYGPK